MPPDKPILPAMEILSSLQRADRRLLAKIFRQGERRAVIPLARAVSRSGDGYLHALLPLAVALSPAGLAGTLALLPLFLTALCVERALYFCLKNGLRRARPQDCVAGFRSLITASDKFSFPSGHSSAAFLLATCLALVFGAPVAALYLWAAAVALSRVLLGVHFPGDILAGSLMGTAVALGCAGVMGLS